MFCTCKVAFLLIRPIVVFSPFSLPSPVMLHGTIRNDDFKRNTALQCWNNVVTTQNNVATMLQRCVALNRRCESSRGTSPLAIHGFVFCLNKLYILSRASFFADLALAKSIYYFFNITSEVKQYYLSYRPRTECSISQFSRQITLSQYLGRSTVGY